MKTSTKVCWTLLICWTMFCAVLLYAIHGHRGTKVCRQTWVEVLGDK